MRGKLVLVTASYPVGPFEAFLDDEITALVQMGYRITIVPLWPRGSRVESDSRLPGETKVIAKPLVDWEILTGAMVELISSPMRVGSWLLRLLRSGGPAIVLKNAAVMPKALWLARRLRQQDADHLHVHWAATTATCAMIAADLAGTHWSMTCHRWDIYENNWLAEKGRRAKFVRFISQRGCADGQRFGVPAAKATLIHMGVRVPRTQRPLSVRSGGPFRMICPANLVEVKGHRFLIEAVAILRQRAVPVVLSLAGDGVLRERLEHQVRAAGLEDIVKFLGHMSHERLLAAYAAGKFELLVLPSVDLGGGEHEGIPVSLLEGMANGLPVLSTRTGSITELLPERLGSTVPDKDAPALAEGIARLANNEPYRARYADAQWEIVQDWSSQKAAKSLSERIKGV